MQGSSISKLIITFIVMISAVYVTFDVMASGGNAVGKLYMYILFASAAFGLFFPRAGFIYLLCLTAYIDYFKRLMILDAGIQLKDIYAVLGIAPATLAGVTVSVFYESIQGKKTLAKGQVFSAIAVFIVMGGVAALGLATQSASGRAFGDTINLMVYIAMFAVVPLLFKTPGELGMVLRALILIYFPAALYMIYHGYAGITDLEMKYVKSGLTVEIRQLREAKFRPFGTMSSAGAASIMFSVLAALVVTGPWGKPGENGKTEIKGFSFMKVLLAVIFAAAAGCTLTRTGWVLGAIALIGGICFRYRVLTWAVYAFTMMTGSFLVFGASWILRSGALDKVDYFLRGFSDSNVMDRQLSILTFSDRLKGFESLTDFSRTWTPFGWKFAGRSESQKPFSHDALTDSIIRFGYVPMVLVAVVGLFGLIKMHSVILAEKSPANRSLGAACAGAWLALAVGCLSTFSQLYFFPVNTFLWFFPSVILSIYFYRKKNPQASMVMVREEGRVPVAAPLFTLQTIKGQA